MESFSAGVQQVPYKDDKRGVFCVAVCEDTNGWKLLTEITYLPIFILIFRINHFPLNPIFMKPTIFFKATSLFLLIFVLFASCKKKKDDTTPSEGVPVCQFKATVDGVTKDFKVITGSEPYDCSVGGSGVIGTGSGSSTQRIFEASMSNTNTNEYLNIWKGTLVIAAGGYPSDAEFHAFFNTGSVAYSNDAASGIQLVYVDASGTIWTTNGVQSGSTFNFTTIEKVFILGEAVVNFNATFNCILYDGNGNSKTLTNGTAKLSFQNI
jgi:hypothetical protein